MMPIDKNGLVIEVGDLVDVTCPTYFRKTAEHTESGWVESITQAGTVLVSECGMEWRNWFFCKQISIVRKASQCKK